VRTGPMPNKASRKRGTSASSIPSGAPMKPRASSAAGREPSLPVNPFVIGRLTPRRPALGA
jgi:hypothetical protein